MPARERHLLAVGEIEARDGRALEPAEDKPALRLEAAADDRPFRRPLGHHVGLLGVESWGRLFSRRKSPNVSGARPSSSGQDLPNHLGGRVGDRDVAALDVE